MASKEVIRRNPEGETYYSTRIFKCVCVCVCACARVHMHARAGAECPGSPGVHFCSQQEGRRG